MANIVETMSRHDRAIWDENRWDLAQLASKRAMIDSLVSDCNILHERIAWRDRHFEDQSLTSSRKGGE